MPALSFELLASKFTGLSMFTVWSCPAFATGFVMSLTVIVTVSVALFSAVSFTVRVIVYMPGLLNVYEGFSPVSVLLWYL